MRLTTALMLLAAFAGSAVQAKDKDKPKPVVTPAPGTTAAIPPPLTADNTWNLDLSDGGRVVIQLRPDKAPLMVDRIRVLTRRGFYNGLTFHRVIEGFMAQGGDPKGTGEGGSDLPDVKAEFNELPHVRGAVAAARAQDENSANSQFYIVLSPVLRLDNHYTVFGRVISGMQYADAIEKGEPPANPTRIVTATIGAEAAAPVTAPAPVVAPAAAPGTPGEPDKPSENVPQPAPDEAEPPQL